MLVTTARAGVFSGLAAVYSFLIRGLMGLEDDMQVVGLDDESVDTPGTANGGLTEKPLKSIRIGVVAYDVLTTIAARHCMVNRARILKSSVSRRAAYRAKLDLVRRESTWK